MLNRVGGFRNNDVFCSNRLGFALHSLGIAYEVGALFQRVVGGLYYYSYYYCALRLNSTLAVASSLTFVCKAEPLIRRTLTGREKVITTHVASYSVQSALQAWKRPGALGERINGGPQLILEAPNRAPLGL